MRAGGIVRIDRTDLPTATAVITTALVAGPGAYLHLSEDGSASMVLPVDRALASRLAAKGDGDSSTERWLSVWAAVDRTAPRRRRSQQQPAPRRPQLAIVR